MARAHGPCEVWSQPAGFAAGAELAAAVEPPEVDEDEVEAADDEPDEDEPDEVEFDDEPVPTELVDEDRLSVR